VWQGQQEGPIYMVEALEAQMSTAGYNYGFTNSTNGDGAEGALTAAGGNFDAFNREQQAEIIQHYYVRKYETPVHDYAAWQPYADVVHA